ncbi:MAG: nucleotidyltransferase family protein, partial [Gemmatimonadaceae bacterium]
MPAIADRAAELTEREEELLLYCARPRIDADSAELIAGLADDAVRWHALHRVARRHGVVPQLYAALRKALRVVPESILAALKQECDANAVRNLGMTSELVRVIRALERSGVAALAYKGPALALQAYGSLAARQFGDLDILVRRSDIARARSALGAIGYGGDAWPLVADENAYLRRAHVHVFSGADGTRLELHWEFAPPELPVRLNVDEMWDRLQRIRLGDVNALALGPEDLLLVLCVHGCRHVWARLKGVCDVAQVILHLPLEWPVVFDRAQKLDAQRMLYLGLALSRDLLHVPVAPEINAIVDADPAVR